MSCVAPWRMSLKLVWLVFGRSVSKFVDDGREVVISGLSAMEIPPELSKQIEQRLSDFIADQSNPDYLRHYAAKFKILPLYLGWTAFLAINPEGEIIYMPTEGEPIVPRVETDPVQRNLALCQGSKRYPELACLIPPKPDGANVCPGCNGTGVHPSTSIETYKALICRCGGAGWLP